MESSYTIVYRHSAHGEEGDERICFRWVALSTHMAPSSCSLMIHQLRNLGIMQLLKRSFPILTSTLLPLTLQSRTLTLQPQPKRANNPPPSTAPSTAPAVSPCPARPFRPCASGCSTSTRRLSPARRRCCARVSCGSIAVVKRAEIGMGNAERSGGKTHFIVPSVQRPEIDSAKEPVGRGMLLV